MASLGELSSEELNLIRFNKITTKALGKNNLSTQELRGLKANLIAAQSKENEYKSTHSGNAIAQQLQRLDDQLLKKSRDDMQVADKNEPSAGSHNTGKEKMGTPDSEIQINGSARKRTAANAVDMLPVVAHLTGKKKQPSTHTPNGNTAEVVGMGAAAALQQPYVFSDTTSADQISSLLHEQKTISSLELEHEQQTQQALIEEIAELTHVLKESSMQLNKSVVLQNAQLANIEVVASENKDELHSQQREVANRTKTMTRSLYGTIAIIVAVMTMFIFTYAIIRLFPASNSLI